MQPSFVEKCWFESRAFSRKHLGLMFAKFGRSWGYLPATREGFGPGQPGAGIRP